MANVQPVVSPREYGILAGLVGRSSWDNPYDHDAYRTTWESEQWNEGREIGEALRAVANAHIAAENIRRNREIADQPTESMP